ncbi:MAG: hypothetical protein GY953_46480, partial [bacterium]|nr:hypothetical protein [bacterium]
GAVRAGLSTSQLDVSIDPARYCIRKGRFCRPALPILEIYRASQKHLAHLFQPRTSNVENPPPGRIDHHTKLSELLIPPAERRSVRPGPKCRVPLFEGAPESPPILQVTLFHVERYPVYIAPPVFRAPGHKIVNIGVNNLER